VPPHYARIDKVEQFRAADFLAGNRSQLFTNSPPGLFYYGDPGVPLGGTTSDYRTFAPRAGLAIDLTGKSRSVLRMAYGIFFDQPKLIEWNRFQITQPWAQTVSIPAPPGVADPFAGSHDPLIGFNRDIPPPKNFPFVLPVAGVTVFSGRTQLPYLQQWNVTLEHAISSFLIRAGYVGTKGTHLEWGREANLPVYIPGASTIANIDTRRPFAPYYQALGVMHFDSNSIYHALQLTVERRVGAGFSILASYTFSKSIDYNSYDAEGQTSDGPLVNDNLKLQRGVSTYNAPHRIVGSVVYQVPSPRTGIRALDLVARHWQISGIVTILPQGFPFTVAPGVDAMMDGYSQFQRADQIQPNASLAGGRSKSDWLAHYFNTSAFAVAAPGRMGFSGRNILYAPGSLGDDVSVSKELPIHERLRMQFRSEFFNIANRASFGAPNSTVTSPLFGQIRSANSPRILQFALRLAF
jgi:hypothetical protein